MKPETLEALRASIAHWESNANAKDWSEFSYAPEDCALCARFTCGVCERDDGELCPIRKASGRRSCYNTPYSDIDMDKDFESQLPAIRDELDFLRGILAEAEGSHDSD